MKTDLHKDFEEWHRRAFPGLPAEALARRGDGYGLGPVEDAFVGFRAAHALYAPRWIPVEAERPPSTPGVQYLCRCPDRVSGSYLELLYRADGYWLDFNGDPHEPSHYMMPLPSTEGLE